MIDANKKKNANFEKKRKKRGMPHATVHVHPANYPTIFLNPSLSLYKLSLIRKKKKKKRIKPKKIDM